MYTLCLDGYILMALNNMKLSIATKNKVKYLRHMSDQKIKQKADLILNEINKANKFQF